MIDHQQSLWHLIHY